MSNERQPGFLLSILIPTMPVRVESCKRVLGMLHMQATGLPVELLIDDEMGISIGVKRNQMLERAKGKYVAFVDDDDTVSMDYIRLLLEGCEKDVDCCSLVGIITFDGERPKRFVHSMKYKEMYETETEYIRPVNHLNAVKREHALAIGFPDYHRGEDSMYCMRLSASGLLKAEHVIDSVIYNYLYIQNKPTFYR